MTARLGIALGICCVASIACKRTQPPEPAPESIAPPPEAAPEVAPERVETRTLAADADPLLQLLGNGVPQAVEVLAVHETGSERIALYRLDVVTQWASGRPEDEGNELFDPLGDVFEACTFYGEEISVGCVEKSADQYPGVPSEVAGYYASDGRAFEVAHVRFEGETKGTVLARKRLYDHGYACDDCWEPELAVSDIDGDSRSEIQIVFGLLVPSVNNFGLHQSPAVLAFVLDQTDFHVQFATTRKWFDEGGDLTWSVDDFETTFEVRDTNRDGHADLVVHEVGTSRWTDAETGESESKRTDETTKCVWERAGDRWACPKALGTQLIDGSKLTTP